MKKQIFILFTTSISIISISCSGNKDVSAEASTTLDELVHTITNANSKDFRSWQRAVIIDQKKAGPLFEKTRAVHNQVQWLYHVLDSIDSVSPVSDELLQYFSNRANEINEKINSTMGADVMARHGNVLLISNTTIKNFQNSIKAKPEEKAKSTNAFRAILASAFQTYQAELRSSVGRSDFNIDTLSLAISLPNRIKRGEELKGKVSMMAWSTRVLYYDNIPIYPDNTPILWYRNVFLCELNSAKLEPKGALKPVQVAFRRGIGYFSLGAEYKNKPIQGVVRQASEVFSPYWYFPFYFEQ
jgi:hypothetical protein